jgi:hypothetical protein
MGCLKFNFYTDFWKAGKAVRSGMSTFGKCSYSWWNIRRILTCCKTNSQRILTALRGCKAFCMSAITLESDKDEQLYFSTQHKQDGQPMYYVTNGDIPWTRNKQIQWNLNPSFLDGLFPSFSSSGSWKKSYLNYAPMYCLPYPSFFSRTPDINDELRFHCTYTLIQVSAQNNVACSR